MNPSAANAIAWVVFVVVYAGLAVGRLPLLQLDRAGIALVGAAAMMVTDVVAFDEAVAAIDFRTIALLFGMMVVVAYLRLGGFFRSLAEWVLSRARSPHAVLGVVVALSGVLSALLVNDVVCLALGPVVIRLARRLRRDPVPYLVALATSANVGSVATITGNPQNMIIGSLSGISYAAFAATLAPVAAFGLLADYVVLRVAFRGALAREADLPEPADAPGDPAGPPTPELLPKGVAVLAGAVVLFFAGAPIALVALGAAALLMAGRVRPERLYAQVDWNLLVMFAGLFVVVLGFERHAVSRWNLTWLGGSNRTPVPELTGISAALSNLVSNVPAVLVLKPVVTALAPPTRMRAWTTLAMASTLSGNLTPIASVANLIVVERSRREGVDISLGAYCRAGVPVTLATLAAGVGWMTWMR